VNPTVEQLEGRFGLPGLVRFERGEGGLPCAVVTTPRGSAHVYLHGGHVTHYQPRGQVPVLFLSERSHYAAGAAIRGGVPIIFPWFGPRTGHPASPAHGLARQRPWTVTATRPAPHGAVVLALELAAGEDTRHEWDADFQLRYTVTVGDTLDLVLVTENRSRTPIVIEQALHTYLAVADVREVAVAGLAGTTYIDKTDGMRRTRDDARAVHFAAETDRVYLDTTAACIIDDPGNRRQLLVAKDGSQTTVVWNPGPERARTIADLGEDDWRRFVCVETANAADNALTLAPGAAHRLRATVRSGPRAWRADASASDL
jgi:D-hexose-6-phosphate mutarotase